MKRRNSLNNSGVLVYLICLLGLVFLYFLFRDVDWNVTTSLNTIIDINSVLIPLIVSVLVLVRFPSKKNYIFLFIGIGFLGATILDAYDSIMTTMVLEELPESQYGSFFTWGWFASRLFLSVFIFLSYVLTELRKIHGKVAEVSEPVVYALGWILLLAAFIFLGFVDFPQAYIYTSVVSRPYELLAGMFFLLSFIGYLKKGDWRNSNFEFWVIISLLISFMGQVMFMAFSKELFDPMYYLAELAKIISYLVVLVAIIADVFTLFKEAVRNEKRLEIQNIKLRSAMNELEAKSHKLMLNMEKIKKQSEELKRLHLVVENTSDHIIITDNEGTILYANKAAVQISGYTKEEIIFSNPKLWGGRMPTQYYEDLWDTIKIKKKEYTGEFVNRKKNGEIFIEEITITPILDDNNNVQYFVAIGRDVTQFKAIENVKSEFISLVSHQLKTPISTIRWYTEAMIQGDMGDMSDLQKEALQTVYSSSARMANLIQIFLHVSKIEMGSFRYEPEPLNIAEEIRKVENKLKVNLERKNMEVEIKEDAQLPLVDYDANLLDVIIQNLFSNAIKYSDENTKIEITVKKIGNNIEIIMKDQGCGIPQDQHAKIFSKMFRADNAKQIDPNGTGLGLYIVKKILDKTGGEIAFKSEEDVGTTFFIKLPIRRKSDKIRELKEGI
ncbi:PAS domain S-box protein [Candidatus Dojkabacteria bacterium]|nr:PAS domain S-box protein [Candidatus Dojkabacteria bacterium]